ncbi:hypothetical protein HII36_11690 [Nonomuraea sp. NN258]|uniref:hypothetical protein n=1 Tax=Nonomuraea antri TaxID=2730852 RepID=UPI001568944D|nr:hypothetical protein [Nonomuraea antri]NRQ32495.1 hypothetical protein [Nonomuraea antri]
MILSYVGLVPTVLLFSVLAEESRAATPDDTMTVFCLSPDHRPELLAAAGSLGLASPSPSLPPGHLWVGGKAVDLETWRAQHRADFDRTCRALLASEPQVKVTESKPFWVRMGEILVPAAFGALLTFIATGWRASIDRGARDADALRTAVADFRGAIETYASEWARGNSPDAVTVRLRRTDLLRQIGRVISFHSSWHQAKRLRDRVKGDELAEGDANFWSGDSAARQAKAAALRGKLDTFDADVETVATALSRPIRSGLPGSGIRRR